MKNLQLPQASAKYGSGSGDETPTLEERREEDAARVRDHAALAADADRRPDIVAGDHARGDVSAPERCDGGCCAGLELVLEDDEAKEAQV